jgi:hypothetical protein
VLTALRNLEGYCRILKLISTNLKLLHLSPLANWHTCTPTFEVFMAVKMEIVVIWVLLRAASIFTPEDGGSRVVRNVGIQPPHYTERQPNSKPHL